MKKIITTILLSIPVLGLSQFSKVFTIKPFKSIEVSTGLTIKYTVEDDKCEMKAESNKEEILDKIEAINTGDVLKIKVKKNSKINCNKTFIYISHKVLEKIESNSGATFSLTNTMSSNNIKMEANSGSSIRGDFNAQNLIVDCNSGASIHLSIDVLNLTVETSSGASCSFMGKTKNATISSNSGSSFSDKDLEIMYAILEADSGGSIEVSVTESITAKADSGGSIYYYGNPKNKTIEKDITGTIKSK